jgi:hypothetical protein
MLEEVEVTETELLIKVPEFNFFTSKAKWAPPASNPQQIKDQQTIDLLLSAPFFHHYVVLTHDNHRQPIPVTVLEVIKSIPPVTTSYVTGAIAAIAFIGVSQKAAKGDPVNYYLNPTGAVLLNFLVSGFFFNLPVSSKWDALVNRKMPQVNEAFQELQNLTSGLCAKLGRGLKQLGLFSLILLLAFFGAYPSYALDIQESNDPEFIANAILLTTTMLQYNGVEALLFKHIQMLIVNPLKRIYHKLNDNALRNHQIETTISLLKANHKEAWESVHQKVLGMIAKNHKDLEDSIYPLLTKEAPTQRDSIALLIKLLQLAKSTKYQASPAARLTFQIASLAMTIASLPGYFLLTKESAAEYAALNYPALINDAFKEWLLGSAIFLISSALSLDVGWVVGSDLYDKVATIAHGIKKSWSQSQGIWDFIKTAWQQKGNLASWYKLTKFPLSIQQSPSIMVPLMGFFYVLSYWSTQTSTFLNEEKLGKDASQYLEIATVISVMLFNSFPVLPVLGSAQRFLMRLLGPFERKREIQLECFIQRQIAIINEIDDHKFLSILHDIVEFGKRHPDDVEYCLTTFFGNKTPATIFPEEEYKEKKFGEIIRDLVNQHLGDRHPGDRPTTTALSTSLGLFSRRKPPEDGLRSPYTYNTFSLNT